ncbi:MAG: hypothetical protein V4615_13215 [Bacteroidota bacterium]
MRSHFYSFIFLLVAQSLYSQKVSSDTLPYKIAKYEVKKQEKVSALAQKLKVDPSILVKLNKFRSIQSVVSKGQRIKVPVYPKESKPKSKKEKEDLKKPDKKETTKHSKSQNYLSDSIGSKVLHKIVSSDVERDKVRLIFIDASLELNEAMMEGVKASLYTIDTKNESDRAEVNGNTAVQKAKITHNQEVVIPYILHIQDSLSKEIALLKAEKKNIEERINLPLVKNNTVAAGNDVGISEGAAHTGIRTSGRTIKQVITKETPKAKDSKKNKEKEDKKHLKGNISDTMIVYDFPGTGYKNTKSENHESQFADKKISYSDTIRIPNTYPDIKKDTSVSVKTKSPNSNDSLIIKPIIKSTLPLYTKSEIQSQKSNSPVNGADSVKRIKAEFFLKRGKKAITEKNFKSAEQYLEKSIELYPLYFDAWHALAEMNEHAGSLQKSLKGYKMCEKIDSTYAKLYCSIGNIYLRMKQKNAAYDAYTKAILLKSDDIPALMARASILTDWKKYKEAISDYDMVLKTDQLYPYAYKARGQTKLLVKDFASAVDDFTRFLIFEETDPSAYFYRGLAKIGNNELLDGCMDLSISAGMGYSASEKAIKTSCE